jgi:hypothetical protein
MRREVQSSRIGRVCSYINIVLQSGSSDETSPGTSSHGI